MKDQHLTRSVIQYHVIGKYRHNHLQFFEKPRVTTTLAANDIVVISGVICHAVGGFLPPYQIFPMNEITIDDIKAQHAANWQKRIFITKDRQWVSITELVEAADLASDLAAIAAEARQPVRSLN